MMFGARRDYDNTRLSCSLHSPGRFVLISHCACPNQDSTTGRAALLVYPNISEYGIRQREIEASLRNATAPAKNAFTAVWVLWKDRAYHVWQNGCPVDPS